MWVVTPAPWLARRKTGRPPGFGTPPVYEKEVGRYPNVKRMFIPTLCNHCEDAPCLNACPTGAIFKREDGIVMVNEEVCCGSQACVAACPYGAMHFLETEESEFGGELTPLEKMNFAQWETGTVQKCTFCAHRIDQGVYEPACVETCPAKCRFFGDLDDPQSEVSQRVRNRNAQQPREEYGTKPSVYYVR